ncbi:aminopeptidase P family protein [Spiractinospora alimapuensis]|uniref:M24 family metallopeptidase n=1 Tax=Spiractinospora alimapuensis TaxID=2820884 RepID=UPI001F3A4FC1|nr:Xaa-Pro peptidase family protein [Spiractinospora alimapuensis]QVQ50744.1 aminopeptidase P family protein [Spiractinospora alimapuensis]
MVETEGPSFGNDTYRARQRDIRERMARLGVDAMLVFRPSSVEYLCGYHTMETAPQPLLVTESTSYLYVPDLEVGRALATSRVDNIRYCGYADGLSGLDGYLSHAVGLLPAGARVGVEFGHASTPPQAVEILRAREITVVDGDYLVERARLVLSEEEIRCVEQAGLVADAGTKAAVAEAGRDGATDSSVCAAIAEALYRDADSSSVWGPVAATGPRGGIPHATWVNRPVADGTTFVEYAGTHKRYHAPLMRTLLRGPLDPADAALAQLSRDTVQAVLETAKPGVLASEVAARATEAISPLPDDVMFHFMFGYPVGLAHKPHWMDGVPFYLSKDNHEPLQAGMAFHIPGSFRSFGRAGVGLSQTFVIEDGGARVVTHGAADLIEVG